MILSLIALAICAALAYMYFGREQFATKQEKAASIYQWFMHNPAGGYDAYRRDLNRASNIVEYEDAMRLFAGGRASVEAIAAIL